jgi:hypothetical protein
MNHTDTMRLALDALINVRGMHYTAVIPAEKAIAALTAALAEPSAEPATVTDLMQLVYDYADAFHDRIDSIEEVSNERIKELKAIQIGIGNEIKTKLEATLHPPVPHQPLTDEEVTSIVFQAMPEINSPQGNPLRKLNAYRSLVRAGEAAIRSKT